MAMGNGGIIGPRNVPTPSAAPGVWSLAEAQQYKAAGLWPVTTPPFSSAVALQGGATSYLSRTFGAGNRKKFALSYFVRTPASFSAQMAIFGGGSSSDSFFITSTGQPGFLLNNGASGEQWATAGLSTSTYSHVLHHVDTDAAAGDRLRLWVNGTEVTSFGRDNNPSSGELAGTINNSAALRIGRAINDVQSWSSSWIFDEIAFFDGQLPDIADVRDSVTGKPKDLSALNFGTTGFWLRFEGGTAALAGVDSSGLGNDWTGTNIVDGDLVSTVP